MIRQNQYPDRVSGSALSGGEGRVMLNGMRVEFSERVPLYPLDLEHVATPEPSADHDRRR